MLLMDAKFAASIRMDSSLARIMHMQIQSNELSIEFRSGVFIIMGEMSSNKKKSKQKENLLKPSCIGRINILLKCRIASCATPPTQSNSNNIYEHFVIKFSYKFSFLLLLSLASSALIVDAVALSLPCASHYE